MLGLLYLIAGATLVILAVTEVTVNVGPAAARTPGTAAWSGVKPANHEQVARLMEALELNAVIVWGHAKVGAHTHSYIHEAWFRAATQLNIAAFWVDDHPDSVATVESALQSSSTERAALFICEGQACKHMPVWERSYYVCHNVDARPDIPKEARLNQQFHNCDSNADSFPVFSSFQRLSSDLSCAYMPWATNLMPSEFPEFGPDGSQGDGHVTVIGQSGSIYRTKIDRFMEGAKGLSLQHRQGVVQDEMVALIGSSSLAPALLNQWQKEHGYLPCRLYKNVSYGAIPLTTSVEGARCLHGLPILSEDEVELARLGLKAVGEDSFKSSLRWQRVRELVKARHTYLSRFEFLLTCLLYRTLQARPGPRVGASNRAIAEWLEVDWVVSEEKLANFEVLLLTEPMDVTGFEGKVVCWTDEEWAGSIEGGTIVRTSRQRRLADVMAGTSNSTWSDLVLPCLLLAEPQAGGKVLPSGALDPGLLLPESGTTWVPSWSDWLEQTGADPDSELARTVRTSEWYSADNKACFAWSGQDFELDEAELKEARAFRAEQLLGQTEASLRLLLRCV